MTSWSALATMTRSTGSSSSAVRRSTVTRSSTVTIRASDPSTPGGVADQAAPGRRRRRLAAQRPRLHRRHDRLALAEVAGVAASVDGHHDRGDGVVVAGPVLGAWAGMPARPLVALGVVLVVATARHREKSRPDLGEPRERLRRRGDVLDEHSLDGGADDDRRMGHPVVGVGVESARRAGERARRRARPRARSRRRRGRAARWRGPRAGRSRDPRMWAIPRSREGVSASAQSAATAGCELAGVVQVDVDALDGASAGDGQPVVVEDHLGPHPDRAGRAGRRRPGWSATATRARARGRRWSSPASGTARRWTGRARWSRRRLGWATAAPSRCSQPTRPRHRARAGTRRSSRCGGATAPVVPRGGRSRPRRTPPRRAAARRRTGWTRTRR